MCARNEKARESSADETDEKETKRTRDISKHLSLFADIVCFGSSVSEMRGCVEQSESYLLLLLDIAGYVMRLFGMFVLVG